MNIINEKIEHDVFGEGTVISREDGRINIQFSEQYGIKQFLYPDAFEKHLRLYNHDVELSVLEELHDKQAQIEAERLRKQQKQEQEEADRIKVLKKSEHIVRKKKSTTKSKTSKQKSINDVKVSEKAEDSEK